MPYYTHEQNELIKNLLNEAIAATSDEGTRTILKDTLAASELDHQIESCTEDVRCALDNLNDDRESHIVLTEDQLDDIVRMVINYDQSDYNNFIEDVILQKVRS